MTLAGKFGDPKTERDIRSAKRFNFFALIMLFLLLVGAFILYLQLVQQQHELEVKTQQLADSTAQLRRFRSEMEAVQSSLSKHEIKLEQQLQSLSNSVENRDYDSARTMASRFATQLAYHDSSGMLLVHLYSWQPKQQVLHHFEHFFVQPDYMLVLSENLQALPEWMGKSNAVYYYDAEVAPKARKIATQLTQIANAPFLALPGNPNDAPKSTNHQWIRIHYLGATPPATQQ